MSKLIPPVSSNDHIQGFPEATIELVQYGDFQCPYCGQAYPMIKMIQQNFGKSLRFVFRHFPLSNIHEYALPAAIAAEAADRQQKFWEMHDLIYEKQAYLNEYSLLEFAMELRLKLITFKADLLDNTLAKKVEADFESGIRSGVNGTPSFFINGKKYTGDLDYVSLAEAMTEKQHIQ